MYTDKTNVSRFSKRDARNTKAYKARRNGTNVYTAPNSQSLGIYSPDVWKAKKEALRRSRWLLAHPPTPEIEIDGVTFEITHQPDDYCDQDDFYGELSDDWSEFKVKNPDADRRSYDPKYLYYHSQESYADRRKWMSKQGYSKGNADYYARLEILRDYEVLCQFIKGDRYNSYVTVTAYYDGEEIDSESTGGVDLGDSYADEHAVLKEVGDELRDQLLDRLTDKLKEIAQTKLDQAVKMAASVNLRFALVPA